MKLIHHLNIENGIEVARGRADIFTCSCLYQHSLNIFIYIEVTSDVRHVHNMYICISICLLLNVYRRVGYTCFDVSQRIDEHSQCIDPMQLT